jgi:ubiquinone/menaquinone biosynthesis C-methylase UbiE
VDYDTTSIPDGYDKGRSLSPELLRLWLTTVAGYTEGLRVRAILDLGCGTGRFTSALAEYFDAEAIGVDPSAKMLSHALAKPSPERVRYLRASGESIPLASASVDLVFMSMVFHHFVDPGQVARECQRVLRAPGLLFVRTGTRDSSEAYPQAEFFPTSRPLLDRRLPTRAFIQEVIEAAGLRTLDVGVFTQQIAPDYATYADKLSAGADSILAELSPEEFEQGLNALRDHAARTEPTPVNEPIDYFVFESATAVAWSS